LGFKTSIYISYILLYERFTSRSFRNRRRTNNRSIVTRIRFESYSNKYIKQISSATSNFLVLFTSGSTSIQFIFLNMMNYEYGIFCVISSVIGSFVGTILIQKLIEKTKRASMIVFLLFIVMLFSTFLIPINTIMQMRTLVKDGYSIWEFSSLCKN